MVKKLSEKGLGYSLAIFSGLSMILFGIFGNLGIYLSAVNQMAEWHILFSLSPLGILLGAIEASFWGFVSGWLIAYFYNRFY